MSEDKHLLQQCYHCGNTGLLKVLCKNDHEYGGPVYDDIGDTLWAMAPDHCASDYELVNIQIISMSNLHGGAV